MGPAWRSRYTRGCRGLPQKTRALVIPEELRQYPEPARTILALQQQFVPEEDIVRYLNHAAVTPPRNGSRWYLRDLTQVLAQASWERAFDV